YQVSAQINVDLALVVAWRLLNVGANRDTDIRALGQRFLPNHARRWSGGRVLVLNQASPQANILTVDLNTDKPHCVLLFRHTVRLPVSLGGEHPVPGFRDGQPGGVCRTMRVRDRGLKGHPVPPVSRDSDRSVRGHIGDHLLGTCDLGDSVRDRAVIVHPVSWIPGCHLRENTKRLLSSLNFVLLNVELSRPNRVKEVPLFKLVSNSCGIGCFCGGEVRHVVIPPMVWMKMLPTSGSS